MEEDNPDLIHTQIKSIDAAKCLLLVQILVIYIIHYIYITFIRAAHLLAVEVGVGATVYTAASYRHDCLLA